MGTVLKEDESDRDSLLEEADLSTEFDGDSSYENASEESSQVGVDAELPMSPDRAAAVIQALYRRRKAREYFIERVRQAYEKVYDEETDTYFYFNKLKGTSQWTTPKVLLGHPFEPREEWAARKLQCIVRKKRAWGKILAMLNDVYEKEYDPGTDSWFYVNKVTNESRWEKPVLFGQKEPPTNSSDAALFSKDEEIKELREALQKEKKEAEEVRKALEDKVTEEKVRNGEMDPDEAKGRSRHMDEWDVDTVVVWFHSVGYAQFDASLREHQVDGLLLLHLMNEDWAYLGINSPLAIRRIDVAMQEYRLRFEHKQAGGGDDSDDCSNISGSDTPSDLLDEEDMYGDDDDSDNQNDEERVDADEGSLGEDELAELRQDEENITKEIIFEGEESRGRPSPGDIVRIHYTCTVPAPSTAGASATAERGRGGGGGGGSGIEIENSRKNRRRALEFVAGEGQIVKGIDRMILTMLYGERAKVTITAAYAYGDKGYPPIIPPMSPLVFDVNLLDFRPRPRWQKPLVQVLSAPYREAPYAPREALGDAARDSGSGGTGQANSKESTVGDVPYGKWSGR